MRVKIARSAVVALALLAAVAANAQVVDLSRTKCRDFIQFPKETMSFLTMWLDGYLTDDEDPRVVDFTKMKATAEKLGLYCAKNPRMSVLSAAENVMGK